MFLRLYMKDVFGNGFSKSHIVACYFAILARIGLSS